MSVSSNALLVSDFYVPMLQVLMQLAVAKKPRLARLLCSAVTSFMSTELN